MWTRQQLYKTRHRDFNQMSLGLLLHEVFSPRLLVRPAFSTALWLAIIRWGSHMHQTNLWAQQGDVPETAFAEAKFNERC